MSEEVFHLIKRATSLAAQSPAFEKFVTLLENVDRHASGWLRVLMYHRVDEPGARPWLDPSLISAAPRDFDLQMRYLSANYQVVDIQDVIDALRSGESQRLPPRAVMMTFDDGYWDFEEHAWPILKRYGIPATLFVPTWYPDQPERTFWWDDLHQAMQHIPQEMNLKTVIHALRLSNTDDIQSYRQLRSYLKTLKHTEAVTKARQLCSELGVQPATNCIMSWETLRKLANEGLTLGAHTRTHALMDRIPLDEAREEAVGSLEDLEREIGLVPLIFAYPSGAVSDEVIGMLARERFDLAFATKRGINKINRTHPLRIGRINIGPGTTLPILGARLLSWTTHLNWLQTLGNA